MDFPIAFTQDEGEAGIESDTDFAVTKNQKLKSHLIVDSKKSKQKKVKIQKKLEFEERENIFEGSPSINVIYIRF